MTDINQQIDNLKTTAEAKVKSDFAKAVETAKAREQMFTHKEVFIAGALAGGILVFFVMKLFHA